MPQRKQAGDNGAGLLTWVQGLAPAHLYLSEERSARFLSRRERYNAGDAAMLVGCTINLVYRA